MNSTKVKTIRGSGTAPTRYEVEEDYREDFKERRRCREKKAGKGRQKDIKMKLILNEEDSKILTQRKESG